MRSFIATLLFIVALAAAGAAQTASPSAAITEFDVNGLKVIFKKRTSSPTISVGLYVRGGVRNATPETAGLENFALQAAMEGSRNFPKAVLRRELARTGSSIGGASGTDYGAMSVVSTKENFPEMWRIFTDLVTNPTFAKADVERIRVALLAGLADANSQPDSALSNMGAEIVTVGHPYSVKAIGKAETVAKFTPEDLRAYHKQILNTSRLLLVAVGDYEPETFKQMVTASFTKLPKGDYKEKTLRPIEFAKATLDIAERTVPTNYVKGLFQAPNLSDPDYYAMRVAIAILQSRVYQIVRVQRNLSYAPNAEMNDEEANTADIYVTAVDANEAVRLMLAIIEDMKANLVDESEFEGLPGYFLTTYYLDQETDIAQVRSLANYELIGGGWRNSERFIPRINAVTPEAVREVCKKYMKNIRFVVVGDPKAIDRRIFVPGS
ncbi:MAG: putative Zn-dependent peptidase [Acidobacteria bacterium OLB17]|nr:MAG: putative Zn-dependent peptidase [Acidobacteria bacterium OLB17]MCZ2390314.1 insulinase family protein [Acidobacteriota bacterium]